jgi:hypothetical protein
VISFTTITKMTDRSGLASVSAFGSSLAALGGSLAALGVSNPGTRVSASGAVLPVSAVAHVDLPVRDRAAGRPAQALEAAEGQVYARAFAAAGAGMRKQTTQQYLMWAFRGPEPWSDPA